MPATRPQTVASHSLAFERFVKEPNDTVGLLAYGLYKSAVREEAMEGVAAITPRAPVPAEIQVYRQAAEQRVGQIITDGIAQATAEIQASAAVDAIAAFQAAALAAVDSSKAELQAHIDRRTSFKQAIGTNLVAWLLSVGLTAIILIVAARQDVADRLGRALAPTESTARPPTSVQK